MKQDITLNIEGMHCDMCAANLERELKLVDGIKKAEVSFSSKSAHVVFDDKKTDLQAIQNAVKEAGYQAV